MASESRTTTVRILGHEYRIRTDESAEFVGEVAQFVDETLRAVASRMTAGTPAQVAVLGALNVAEQLFRERRDGNGAAAAPDLEERVRAMVARLEEAVPEPAPRVPKAAVARAGARG
jgi:cell division protein ZapA (FtsZ GTPase activity inhibitor)